MAFSADDNLTTRERIVRWFPLFIIGGVILAFANCFSGAFIFDDTLRIVNNPELFRIWPPWEAISRANRWVVDISFALNYFISKLNAADYHATNVLIHIGAALALYGVVRRTLLLPCFRGRFAIMAPWLAVLIAGLWAVHPLQTESVTYIVQRDESMMGLFFLLALYAFVRGAPGSSHPRLWNNGALVACILGLGTKEVFVTLPVVLVVYDAIFISGSYLELLRTRWKIHAALFLSLGIWVCQMLLIRPEIMGAEGLVYTGITPFTYALTQLQVIPHYLRLAFIPDALCLDYMWPPVESIRTVILPGLITVGLGLWSVYAGLIRRKPAGFLGVAFFVILGPTSSFMALPDVAFEHRMYLPLASVMAGVVMGGWWLVTRVLHQGKDGEKFASFRPFLYGGLLGLALVVTFTGLTRLRNEDYRSESRMWLDVLAKRPDNYRAYIALSKGLMESSRFDETIEWCGKLFKKLPDFGSMKYDEIMRLTQKSDSMTQKLHYYAFAKNNCAIALWCKGDASAAIAHYRESIRVHPEKTAIYNLGLILEQQGHADQASAVWAVFVALAPKDPVAHWRIGLSHLRQEDWISALKAMDEALRVQADYLPALFALGWIRAAAPDPALRQREEALRLATRVNEITHSSIAALDLLGAAWAAAGDFDKAIPVLRAAMALIEKHPPHPLLLEKKQILQRHLELYEKHQPFMAQSGVDFIPLVTNNDF